MLTTKKSTHVFDKPPQRLIDDLTTNLPKSPGWSTFKKDFIERPGHRISFAGEVFSILDTNKIFAVSNPHDNDTSLDEIVNYIADKSPTQQKQILKKKEYIKKLITVYTQNYEMLLNGLLFNDFLPSDDQISSLDMVGTVTSEDVILDIETGFLKIEYNPITLKDTFNGQSICDLTDGKSAGTLKYDLNYFLQFDPKHDFPKTFDNCKNVLTFESEFENFFELFQDDNFNLKKEIKEKIFNPDTILEYIQRKINTKSVVSKIINRELSKCHTAHDKLSLIYQYFYFYTKNYKSVYQFLKSNPEISYPTVYDKLNPFAGDISHFAKEIIDIIEINKIFEQNEIEILKLKSDEESHNIKEEIKNINKIRNNKQIVDSVYYRTYLTDSVREKLWQNPNSKFNKLSVFFGTESFLLPNATIGAKIWDFGWMFLYWIKSTAKLLTELLPNIISEKINNTADNIEKMKKLKTASVVRVLSLPFRAWSFIGRAITSPIRGFQAGLKHFQEAKTNAGKALGIAKCALSVLTTGIAYGAAVIFGLPLIAAATGVAVLVKAATVVSVTAAKAGGFLLAKFGIELGIAVGVAALLTGVVNRIGVALTRKGKEKNAAQNLNKGRGEIGGGTIGMLNEKIGGENKKRSENTLTVDKREVKNDEIMSDRHGKEEVENEPVNVSNVSNSEIKVRKQSNR